MRHTHPIQTIIDELAAITCDVCKQRYDNEVEIQAFMQLQESGGYGSIFGDGTSIQCDICQHCLKQLLGPYLRIEQQEIRV